MTDEEIRIKIAESLGYERRPSEWPNYITWYNPSGQCISRIAHVGKLTELAARVPNYTESLDACAEFEATLTEDELWAYSKLLMDYSQVANGFPLASRSEVLRLKKSTPRECCLAYLKTKGIIP